MSYGTLQGHKAPKVQKAPRVVTCLDISDEEASDGGDLICTRLPESNRMHVFLSDTIIPFVDNPGLVVPRAFIPHSDMDFNAIPYPIALVNCNVLAICPVGFEGWALVVELVDNDQPVNLKVVVFP